MKKIYTLFIILLLLLSAEVGFSQCTCADGSTPDSLIYEQYFDSIITTNTTISFPQFDPAMGILSCFKLRDTVTTVVSYNLENDLPDSDDYNFETFRRSQFTGPGSFFSSITSAPKDFGPYPLAPKDSIGDSVDIGPDTTFYHKYYEKYGASNPAFYGTGTVDFNYLTTSTFTILTGSDNAIFTLRAYTRLDVALVYYWCPLTVLATHLTNFTTSLQNNNVLVQWQVNDYSPNDKYEVESGIDGKIFKTYALGVADISGNLARYKILYTPDLNFSGNLFFRIKQTDEQGRISYSEIRTATINKNGVANYNLYPNPSITGVTIQFNNVAGGDYQVELVNTLGQSSFLKRYTLNQSSAINIEWSHKPAPGIYFLKVLDLNNKTEQVEKLRIL